MDVRKSCHERGNKLAIDEARVRVIRSGILELVHGLQATPDELLAELVWLESNSESLPRVCEQCGRIYEKSPSQRRGCTAACRMLMMQEKRLDTVKSGN